MKKDLIWISVLCAFLLVLIFSPQRCNSQKFFQKRDIATYSLCFAAGVSDGLNDCIIANKFYYAPFWGYADWQKHGNIDGFHVTKGATYVLYSAALAINIGEKQNWKQVVLKGLISLAVSRAGHELTYNVVFKNYPR